MITQLPNAITSLRGLCGPVVMALVLAQVDDLVAFWVFLLAVSTDMVDGFVARRLGATSDAALWLDPLADKLLTDFTWAALALVGHAPVWMAVAVVVRDLAVGAAWIRGSRHGHRWPPRPLGQIAVAFEGIALCVLLFHGPWLDVHWPTVGTILGGLALALSAGQLVEYAVRGREP
jgi:phosphatidylglycerophosphate synthase